MNFIIIGTKGVRTEDNEVVIFKSKEEVVGSMFYDDVAIPVYTEKELRGESPTFVNLLKHVDRG
jgi:hypothetical protein